MFVIKNRKIFVSISAILVSLSVIAIIVFGLNFGIEFKGGSLLEVEYNTVRPEQKLVEESLSSLSLGSILIQPMGDIGYSIKSRDITDQEKLSVLSALGSDATEKSFTSIGPSVGAELIRKSVLCFILVALGIILFIAFSFRKSSKPVSSWKYGLTAILTLAHDVIISVGVFAIIAHFTGAEADTLFVAAVLTILGLSVSDTIVVFDRIRENIRIGQFKTFEETVGRSLNQVYTRSIITSLTIILVLVALVFWGPKSTKMFSIMLTAGMFFGSYSSIFLASPLLVFANNLQKKK
jgi:preprotein translocase subunit SecF